MTAAEDLARAKEFIATLEHGNVIECRLRKARPRENVVTFYDRTIMAHLIERPKDHYRIAMEIGSASRNVSVALGRMASVGIVETINGQEWRLTEGGRAGMMTPIEKGKS